MSACVLVAGWPGTDVKPSADQGKLLQCAHVQLAGHHPAEDVHQDLRWQGCGCTGSERGNGQGIKRWTSVTTGLPNMQCADPIWPGRQFDRMDWFLLAYWFMHFIHNHSINHIKASPERSIESEIYIYIYIYMYILYIYCIWMWKKFKDQFVPTCALFIWDSKRRCQQTNRLGGR